jgi:hypothetical protein
VGGWEEAGGSTRRARSVSADEYAATEWPTNPLPRMFGDPWRSVGVCSVVLFIRIRSRAGGLAEVGGTFAAVIGEATNLVTSTSRRLKRTTSRHPHSRRRAEGQRRSAKQAAGQRVRCLIYA